MKKTTVIVELVLISLSFYEISARNCTPSQTVASGTHAPLHFCSGDLIFQEEFSELDPSVWKHESTLGGGGNWEFQWYTKSQENSVAENGILKIKPTLTADELGEEALSSMTLDLNSRGDGCTNSAFYGCERSGTSEHILNPIKSARINTMDSFSFKYGRVEVSAKLPTGDWLWPAIWMLPQENVYGTWPTSGEIDILESRGNRLLKKNGVNIGVEEVGSTLHWGLEGGQNGFPLTHWTKPNPSGFNDGFHRYELLWTPDSLTFKTDGQTVGSVTPPEGGFWELGKGFGKAAHENPWKNGSKLAPFDQEFHILINLAVGGISYFPDDAENPGGKPWSNKSPMASTDFWNGKNQWLPTWNLGVNEDSYLKVDYVRVFAL